MSLQLLVWNWLAVAAGWSRTELILTTISKLFQSLRCLSLAVPDCSLVVLCYKMYLILLWFIVIVSLEWVKPGTSQALQIWYTD